MDFSNFFAGNGNLAEWVTAGVALVAVVLSWLALASSRKIARNVDFFHIHERLVSIEVQRGRRLLYDAHSAKQSWASVHNNRPADFDAINHAVGTFHTLGQYARSRHISRRRVGRLWHGHFRLHWEAIESFIDWRRRDLTVGNTHLWDDLVWLGHKSGAKVTLSYKLEPHPRSLRAIVRRIFRR